ncbi:transposase [Nitrospira sp. Nam80]
MVDHLCPPPSEASRLIGNLCRQHGIVEQTFYAWKKKYKHLGVSELAAFGN